MTDRPQNLEDVRSEIKDRGIEFLFAQFVDMWGKPSAKLVPATHLDDLFEEGAGFAGFAAGEIGQGPHSADMAAMPDPTSFTPVPWQPNLARFACDIFVEGEPWPYCPRTILRRQLERATATRLTCKIGMEAEFFLLRDNNGTIELADPLDTLDRPCYDMKGLTRQYDFITTLSRYQTELGWDNYANDHEDANSQFESNFRYADALTTADRIVFFRYMVHTLAQQQGHAGHVHAQAVQAPDRQRLPHAHQPVGRRDRRRAVPESRRPPGPRATRSWPTTSSAGC